MGQGEAGMTIDELRNRVKINIALFAIIVSSVGYGISVEVKLLAMGSAFIAMTTIFSMILIPTHHNLNTKEQISCREFGTNTSLSAYLLITLAFLIPNDQIVVNVSSLQITPSLSPAIVLGCIVVFLDNYIMDGVTAKR